MPLPSEELRVVLAPVDLVWARLERPAARRLVEAAVRSELGRVAGFAGRTDAPQVLADRLARRLADQMRLAGPIKNPVGWLIGIGLRQRQRCGDIRCDDRMLLDSGQDCSRCEEKQADRRDQRRAVAAAIDAAMPGASEAERRAAAAKRLHQDVTAKAWAQVHEWDQVRARQAAAAHARAEAAASQPQDQIPVAPVAPVVLPAPRPAAVIPGTVSAPRSACSPGRSSRPCSALRVSVTWTSATPREGRHERQRRRRTGRADRTGGGSSAGPAAAPTA
ncbi:hypothetical protein [Streptomyces sp. NPDC052292]|uniref:hypothetical protein n=1 Tax=Streptomyces sp. NPDC052292 TaxID=3155053 RepID=UPI0034144593